MFKVIFKSIISAIFLGLFILLYCLKGNEAFVNFWSDNVVANYFSFIGNINAKVPFSVFEILLYIAIILVIIFLVQAIIKLVKLRIFKFLSKLLNIVIMATSIVCIYYASTGLSYHRNFLDVPQYNERMNPDKIKSMTSYFITKYNELAAANEFDEDGNVISPYTFDELSNKLLDTYEEADFEHLFDYRTPAKKWLFSWLLSEMKTTGIYFAPTAEVNINSNLLDIETPFTLAHEIAHSKGVMKEGDANLYAMYITLTSNDPYIQLSGYFFSFYSLMNLSNLVLSNAEYSELYYSVSNVIWKQQIVYNEYWSKKTVLNKVQQFFYDIYLRFNGSQKGNDDYTPVEDKEPTGELDDDGEPIYEIIDYSTYQKLYMYFYTNSSI